jgi:hypothetical protein
MVFLNAVALQPPASIMVVGRAQQARPTANYHTLVQSSYNVLGSEFCVSEVVRNSIIALLSQAKQSIIGARFAHTKFSFSFRRVGSLFVDLIDRKPRDGFSVQ